MDNRRKQNQRDKLIETHGPFCSICKERYSPEAFELHHIIPKTEGGPDCIENKALICNSCHDKYHGDIPKRKK